MSHLQKTPRPPGCELFSVSSFHAETQPVITGGPAGCQPLWAGERGEGSLACAWGGETCRPVKAGCSRS